MEAEATLKKWYAQAATALDNEEPYVGVVAALADDLNTSQAIAEMHQLSHADDAPSLRASLKLVGLLGDAVPSWAHAPQVDLSAFETRLAEARMAAMASKDFAQVDALKAQLVGAGVEVRMSKDGVELVPGAGFDPAQLEGLV